MCQGSIWVQIAWQARQVKEDSLYIGNKGKYWILSVLDYLVLI